MQIELKKGESLVFQVRLSECDPDGQIQFCTVLPLFGFSAFLLSHPALNDYYDQLATAELA